MENKRKNLKKNQIVAFLVTVAIVILVNIIGAYVFTRFDLTSEKRYTLSPTTKEILNDLDDYVYFKVYLEGDFPAGFKKLRRETKEMLDEFRAYSKFIDYEFINPSESTDASERNETYKQLYQAGLNPTDMVVKNRDGSSKQMVIWPGALVSYRNTTEIAIDLLENQIGQSSEQALNASMQNLEFRLIDAVKKVTRLQKPNIAFIEGHGELNEQEVHDIAQTLAQNYNVVRLEIDGKIDALMHRTQDEEREVKAFPSYDAIIIAKPTQPFDERDKFLIDQYIMHGGKVLWMVEPVYATMDSLQSQESTIGIEQDLNLDDMLFKYGVRLNRDLLLDLTTGVLPLVLFPLAASRLRASYGAQHEFHQVRLCQFDGCYYYGHGHRADSFAEDLKLYQGFGRAGLHYLGYASPSPRQAHVCLERQKCGLSFEGHLPLALCQPYPSGNC